MRIGSNSFSIFSFKKQSHHISYLLTHNVHGNLGTQEDAEQIYLDDELHLSHGNLSQGSPTTIDASIVNPVFDVSHLILGELAKFRDII